MRPQTSAEARRRLTDANQHDTPSHSASDRAVNEGWPVTLIEDFRVLPAGSVPARIIRRMLPMAALVLIAGCSIFAAPTTIRGNKVEAYRLQELVPGTSTQADVTALIGSPTAKASFDPNTWLYITETTHIRVAQTPGVADQAVVVLTFDDAGVLRKIDKVSQDQSLPVTVVARTTPAPGTEASFLQQLLGNVGRFNTTPGTNFAPGGAGPTVGGGL